jgi:small subunit ribosomal protein S20
VPSEVEELAHTRSAKKMITVMKEQRTRNRSIKSAVKTHIDRAEELISGKEPEPAKEAVRKASIALDKAARKSIIHPNNAARHKSRLMKKLNVAFPST